MSNIIEQLKAADAEYPGNPLLMNAARELESYMRSLHSTQDLLAASERRWQRDITLTQWQCVEI